MDAVKKTKVLIISPGGLENQGGIGRMIGNFTRVWDCQPDAPNFQIVDTRGVQSLLSAQLVFIQSLVTIERELFSGRTALLHIHLSSYGSTLRKFIIIVLSRWSKVPYIIHLHGSEYKKFFWDLSSPLKHLVRYMFVKAERVIVLGKAWQEFVHNEIQVDVKKIVVLPNAVQEPTPIETRRSENICQILFLGRLGRRKGVPELLQALATGPIRSLNWKAVLAGDGDVEEYRAMAESLSIGERVLFPGWVGSETVTKLLGTSDILVLPSFNEGLPMSIIEGMAHGLTIIATPVGSVAEIIETGISGVLVPPGNSELLANSLEQVLTDSNYREKLSSGAKKFFRSHLEINQYARKLEGVYEECLRV